MLYELARWADVVVENYRVGVTRSLGVDYDTLSAINPRLVYCSISGYGQSGPYAGKGGFDLVAQGMSGIMSMTGEPGGRPLKSGIAIYDVGAGLTAAYAILAACIHQMKTGEGQHIDIALAECGLPWFVWEAAAYFAEGTVPQGTGSRHRVSAPYQAFGTRQGLHHDRRGQPAHLGAPVHRGARAPRAGDGSALRDEFRPACPYRRAGAYPGGGVRPRRRRHLDRTLRKGGGALRTHHDFGQAMRDPHYLARGMVQELEHPALGSMKTIGIPTKFSRTPGALRTAAPLMGQHTDEVLRRFGVPADRIADMRARGHRLTRRRRSAIRQSQSAVLKSYPSHRGRRRHGHRRLFEVEPRRSRRKEPS